MVKVCPYFSYVKYNSYGLVFNFCLRIIDVRPTESANLDPWGSQRPQPPTTACTGTGPRPLHTCSKCAAWYSCECPNRWSRDCLGLCSLPLDPLPWCELPGWASVRGDVPTHAGTRCPVVVVYKMGFLSLRRMGGGNGRRYL